MLTGFGAQKLFKIFKLLPSYSMANSFEQRPMNRSSNFDAPLIGNLNTNPTTNHHTNRILNNAPRNSYNAYTNDDVHDTMNHSIHNNQFYSYVYLKQVIIE